MRETLNIRAAQVTERAALEALQWRASLANPGDREVLSLHPDAIELPEQQIADGLVFVAERAGQVLGFAAVLPRDDGDLELDGLFVEPTLQRGGVGRALIAHVVGVAIRKQSPGIHVIGNPHAQAFYEAMGFVRVGEARTRFGPAPTFRLVC